jgi:hypothetical protein
LNRLEAKRKRREKRKAAREQQKQRDRAAFNAAARQRRAMARDGAVVAANALIEVLALSLGGEGRR